MISELYFNESELDDLKSQYSVLGKRIYNFIKYVQPNWNNSTNND